MSRVLLLHGGLQSLSAAYSLKRNRHYVVCMAGAEELIRKSRHIDTFYSISYAISSPRFTEYICTILRNEHIDIVIPMSDSSAEFMSKNKTIIESSTHSRCAVPDYSIFSRGADKASLMDFCEKNHHMHPKTQRLNSSNLVKAAEHVGFPSLIKPNHSVGARGIMLIKSIEELRLHFPQINKEYGECTLQEYINSTGREPYYNVMMYRDKKGKIAAYTITEIQRYYPIKGGSSSFLHTIEDSTLYAECKTILNELNWHGMADFDVLKNENGQYKIIEINPRVPASLRAADIAGVNFPEVMIADLLDREMPLINYQTDKSLRYMGLDLLWLISSPYRFQVSPTWVSGFFQNVHYQDIYANDPCTWFAWLIDGIQKYLSKRKHIQ